MAGAASPGRLSCRGWKGEEMTLDTVICPCCSSENLVGEEECASCLTSLVELERSTRRLRRSFIADDRVAVVPLVHSRTIPVDASLRQALNLMKGLDDACVLVLDHERLAGIVTERDVLCRVIGHDLDLDKTPVSQIMTPDPIRVAMTDRVSDAFNIMSMATLRHLPVVKGERLAGHLTPSSLLAYLARHGAG